MALTTQQFWQQQLTVHQAAQAAAQSDLSAAQARQKAAAAQLATDSKALDQFGAKIAAQRAQLATTTVPAEANALVVQITAQVVLQRHQQGKVLDDQEALADASADADAATLARATARIATVQAAIAAAAAEGAQRDALKAAIAAAPLATIKADATALLASATATHAASRIATDFPAALLDIAGKRHDTRSGRLSSLKADVELAEDAQGAGQAADAGLAGAASQKAIALRRAQAALADPVATAASRYARALAVLQKLEAIEVDATGTVPDVLTDAEKAQLAALAAAGAAAEPTAVALDTDLKAVFSARDALDAQILTQIAADVDALATDPTVAARRAAIVAAQNSFDADLAAFVAANRNDLDQWQAVIPDPAWKTLLDYQEGLAALNELAALDLPALAAAMDSAEGDYTSALAAAELAQRRADARTDAIALRSARLAGARGAIAARLPSAIRGDSY
jgi:hypothetical protein